jgi:hypothetical protein
VDGRHEARAARALTMMAEVKRILTNLNRMSDCEEKKGTKRVKWLPTKEVIDWDLIFYTFAPRRSASSEWAINIPLNGLCWMLQFLCCGGSKHRRLQTLAPMAGAALALLDTRIVILKHLGAGVEARGAINLRPCAFPAKPNEDGRILSLPESTSTWVRPNHDIADGYSGY